MENASALDRVAAALDSLGSDVALQDVLDTIHQAVGFIPPPSVALIAEKTGEERSRIYKAIELSPSWSLQPPGKHKVYICCADNCGSLGGDRLVESARKVLGVDFFQATAQGEVYLEPFHCLGNCACGPNVMIDNVIHGPVEEGELADMLQSFLEK